MKSKLLHTPEGVRDIYGTEYTGKLTLQEKLRERLHLYGYEDIQTPTFEYFDIFSSNIGTTPSKDLYKFFDKEGDTLVLRPDFTPSIARCFAKYYMGETMPVRFCYTGNTFLNTSDLQGKLKESTQIGAELINDAGVDADAEMIALMIECMQSAGLTDFQVTIGNVQYFKGLCEECGILPETELELRDLISNKNYFGAEAILDSLGVSDEIKHKILKVTKLFGSVEKVKEAGESVTNERSLSSVERVIRIHEILKAQGLDSFVNYDFGLLSKYNYYTGIIFRAYTFGNGDAVMKGGRYDSLLSSFGNPAPAIGFAILVDELCMTLRRLKIGEETKREICLIVYDKEDRASASKKAERFRREGKKTVLLCKREGLDDTDYREYAQKMGYTLME